VGLRSFGSESSPLRNYFEKEHISLNAKIAIAYLLTEFLSLSGVGSTIASAQQARGPLTVDYGTQQVGIAASSRSAFVTVKDAIEMTEFGDEDYLLGELPTERVAQFSPNRRSFVVIVKKGRLQTNTNDYRLLLFKADEALKVPIPEVLVSFSSSSNRPGIQEVRWLNDRKLAFLAENSGEEQQLYTINVETKELQKVTNHATGIIRYQITPDEERVFFTARPQVTTLLDEKAKRDGIVITTQPFTDLVGVKANRSVSFDYALFVKRRSDTVAVPIQTHGRIYLRDLWLAPDGEHLVVRSSPGHVPESWKNYNDHALQKAASHQYAEGSVPIFVSQYEIVDTRSQQSQVLIPAPVGLGHSDVVWSPDSKSVVVSGTYLPLEVLEEIQREQRRSNTYVAQVKISSGTIVPIVSKELRLHRWDALTNKILFETVERQGAVVRRGKTAAFEETQNGWREVEIKPNELADNGEIDVRLQEGINTPPRMVARNIVTGQESLLFDLNPQFEQLKLGLVEDVTFASAGGRKVRGGLYRPPDYVPGKRYPLVIQTHGWNPDRFWIRGAPFTTGYAAQPLAGKGIVVIQLEEDPRDMGTPIEIQTEESNYEGAIDYLDGLGLIDRHHVGIVAFSRTGYGVAYALTHSAYQFAAASLDSTVDGGYFYYLASQNFTPLSGTDMESLYGGVPFQNGIASWLKNCPGFNVERIHAAVRLEAEAPIGLTGVWEWFIGMRRLDKPVELIYMPEAPHVLVKPSDQMLSQQGNVDWFCFWLKGEEDPAPAKVEQYARWRDLRKLQQENDKKPATPPSASN